MSNVKKITISGIVIALYVVIMYFTQSFAFGQYQIRIATGIYAFAYHFPFLIIPLGIANLLSNILMGGLGIYDAVGGLLVGIMTSGAIVLIKKYIKNDYIAPLPIAIIPSVVVPIWLCFLINVPYLILAVSVGVGQIVAAYTLGLFIIKFKYIDKLK